MITKQQALDESRFHEITTRANGTCYEWRRNGGTQTWVTRPDEFRIPVKYGMRSYGYIDHNNCEKFYPASNCPNCKQFDETLAKRQQEKEGKYVVVDESTDPFTLVGFAVYDPATDELHSVDPGHGEPTE